MNSLLDTVEGLSDNDLEVLVVFGKSSMNIQLKTYFNQLNIDSKELFYFIYNIKNVKNIVSYISKKNQKDWMIRHLFEDKDVLIKDHVRYLSKILYKNNFKLVVDYHYKELNCSLLKVFNNIKQDDIDYLSDRVLSNIKDTNGNISDDKILINNYQINWLISYFVANKKINVSGSFKEVFNGILDNTKTKSVKLNLNDDFIDFIDFKKINIEDALGILRSQKQNYTFSIKRFVSAFVENNENLDEIYFVENNIFNEFDIDILSCAHDNIENIIKGKYKHETVNSILNNASKSIFQNSINFDIKSNDIVTSIISSDTPYNPVAIIKNIFLYQKSIKDSPSLLNCCNDILNTLRSNGEDLGDVCVSSLKEILKEIPMSVSISNFILNIDSFCLVDHESKNEIKLILSDFIKNNNNNKFRLLKSIPLDFIDINIIKDLDDVEKIGFISSLMNRNEFSRGKTAKGRKDFVVNFIENGILLDNRDNNVKVKTLKI